MKRKLAVKFLLIASCALFALVVASSHAFAQCAMCKTSLAGSPDAAKLAERFNFAIFVLLIPPVVLFCGFIVALYRFRKAPGENTAQGGAIKHLLHSFVEKLSVQFGGHKRKGAKATTRLTERSLH